MPLDQVGGVAGCGRRVDAGAVGAGVNGERQPQLLALLVDGVVLALAERGARPGVDHHLHHVFVAADALDLGGRRLRILLRQIDGARKQPSAL